MRKVWLILFVLFLTASSYPQTAIVIGDKAYLRGSAVETGEVVDTLPRGTKVAIIRQQGPWFLVQASPFVGWMHGNSIKFTRGANRAVNSRMPAAAVESLQQTARIENTESVTKTKTEGLEQQLSEPGNSNSTAIPSASEKRVYIRGPRGGCYYVRADGKKVYGDHNLCN